MLICIGTVVCGGEYYIAEGNSTVLTSPGFPNGYANNLMCVWTLTTELHNRVTLTFNTINMEAGFCQFDRVEILDGRKPSVTFINCMHHVQMIRL